MAFLMVGNGLQGSVLGVRAETEGFGFAVTGAAMAARAALRRSMGAAGSVSGVRWGAGQVFVQPGAHCVCVGQVYPIVAHLGHEVRGGAPHGRVGGVAVSRRPTPPPRAGTAAPSSISRRVCSRAALRHSGGPKTASAADSTAAPARRCQHIRRVQIRLGLIAHGAEHDL